MKIVTHNLSKRFNREWIFKNFSYTFNTGQTYAIIGPNGSGKSTLLQILWGQMPASSGEIEFFIGNNPIAIDEVFRSIAIATPYMNLLDEFTLEEMIRFHFKFKKASNNRSVEEIVEWIGLSGARKKLISNFSSGMKQRLKLGLAFNTEAEVLFLDEPTTNLDKTSIQWYWDNFNRVKGKALILIASNDDAEYPSTAEKIDILRLK
jgi:ABC-type multidrug transport system ATPase subunit